MFSFFLDNFVYVKHYGNKKRNICTNVNRYMLFFPKNNSKELTIKGSHAKLNTFQKINRKHEVV